MRRNYIYLGLLAGVFAVLTVVFLTFPRSTFSELEKRDLATFPEFSWDKLASGKFTEEVSTWFSDSEPYRDNFMSLSMEFSKKLKLNVEGDDAVTFHAAEPTPQEGEGKEEAKAEKSTDDPNYEYQNKVTADENAKIAHSGIIVVGNAPNARALMAYGGGAEGGTAYAQAANKYKEKFGSEVNVYCMVIPTAIEYYCPEKMKKASKPQSLTINNIMNHLAPGVKAVNIHQTLGEHAAEDIYLRTDHHWSPLGAYYAAKKFAEVAGVPFRDLSSYKREVVHGFVGTMYSYSKDIAVKQSPEDFVYYVPQGVEYTTTYTNYTINKDYQVTGMGKPYQSNFFVKYKDGSGGAYCTFMGGDSKITQVRTSTKNGRRVIILKDSFGNAIPGYLFFSFEEIHVIDNRYFTKNMVNYVRENKITDILFANNIFSAYSPKICNKYSAFLTQ
ncbi:MAG: DHHW family protein [Prevotellaceae bacterium]|nr:DHHW family protein [Prevotellaceae bacterium]